MTQAMAGAALVTGAGKRLGAAMALFLAERGHDVAVHYASSGDAAEDVAAQIRAMGRKAVTVQADLLVETETATLVPRAAEALGPLSVLVNNASIFEYDSLESATRDSWDRHFESNLRAPFVLIQAFAAQAPETGRDGNDEPLARALVVNLIDQRVRKLTPEFMTYTLAKMGLWAFTQTAAQALAPRIRVNAIGPGPTLRGGRQSVEHFAKQRAATILGRGADPAGITAALGYFLDAPAVTGQLLCVDGGQHLSWETPDVIGVE
ncbi:short-chain dehydrogenase/reductase SDR [Dinoroseobacter shibae DFL 12 = DSM 16493]|jgi:NAD(P)-dependent dehydrogenase (short-subunit alcohol dehydrogenase family)|uniref:Short-chain dehydrogenase/reductase SDR n=1 Tax=Dinoroseobacter shibae (strain DSM 16493 / NCIMB 14021 / DFL 12) TaxID=398580 RepID=A8LQA3_DINSH|nr:SDR family oxidoreductase [Dinoroseobacter shibae]ABV92389.1 short-chain dehydrogenase/reductase SDR [Dinoroseobacter shibae DFL 12 = DSM 16493]URF47335.1 SDR family oxidoreductase [Dinoroseobacter shibae]URF51646.1 SDR family oxidoreductase [Dinoroseobacter shibae]